VLSQKIDEEIQRLERGMHEEMIVCAIVELSV
jgi:hypothetical protein